VQSQVPGEPKDGWEINPVIKKHLELEIKALQNAPRDADKLRRLLEIKQSIYLEFLVDSVIFITLYCLH
jgi:hypothetical protein